MQDYRQSTVWATCTCSVKKDLNADEKKAMQQQCKEECRSSWNFTTDTPFATYVDNLNCFLSGRITDSILSSNHISGSGYNSPTNWKGDLESYTTAVETLLGTRRDSTLVFLKWQNFNDY